MRVGTRFDLLKGGKGVYVDFATQIVSSNAWSVFR